jgi:membrane-associated phospholipid phosphatase
MRTLLLTLVLLVLVSRPALAPPLPDADVEPTAGTWPTWVVGAPAALRPLPPPAASEADELRMLATRRDAGTQRIIAYWDAGPPSYRWNELAVAEALRQHDYTHVALRGLALLHVTLDDALVATWDAKYAYRRPRPTDVHRDLSAAVIVPPSPSYPAEHAVVAGAAAEVLAHLYPQRAAFFADRAREAAESRLFAAVNYPSDVRAGLALGRDLARRVIATRRSDGRDRPPAAHPRGAGTWRGANPVLPEAAGWRPWVLASADELRPAPPPAHDSAELASEMDELRRFGRTPKTNADAFFWEHTAGGARSYQFWNEVLERSLLEHRLQHNAPRAARAYALLNVALHDVAVACWDAKYAYWALRPVELDPTFQPLFTTPEHPSYPSGHSCLSAAAAAVLGHLFPRDASRFEALASEASESRLWAGIHFRSDLTAGRALGRRVAERVIQRARVDGVR